MAHLYIIVCNVEGSALVHEFWHCHVFCMIPIRCWFILCTFLNVACVYHVSIYFYDYFDIYANLPKAVVINYFDFYCTNFSSCNDYKNGYYNIFYLFFSRTNELLADTFIPIQLLPKYPR